MHTAQRVTDGWGGIRTREGCYTPHAFQATGGNTPDVARRCKSWRCTEIDAHNLGADNVAPTEKPRKISPDASTGRTHVVGNTVVRRSLPWPLALSAARWTI